MKKNSFDIFVIGGGSGGVRAARYAASKGFKVGLAEGWDLGGTCVNRGCIPKKLYSYASHFSDEFTLMNSFGWSSSKPKFSWEKLVRNKKKELVRLNKIYKKLLLDSNVELFENYASFLTNEEILINNTIIRSKKFIIAVGTKPKSLNFCNSKKIITSDQVFDLKLLPKKVLILGGGYISVELASIFCGLGVETTISLRSDNILRGFDQDISNFLMQQMALKGVNFLTKRFPLKINSEKNYLDVNFSDKSSKKFDLVIEAVGREPNLNKLNIKNSRIKLSKNSSIIVNKNFRTTQENIYAIGDIIDKVQLTPVAIAEAMWLVDSFSTKSLVNFDYSNIPTAVFSNPNLACVGLTEEEAKKKYKKIKVYKSKFRPLRLVLSSSKEEVFIKILINKSNDKILGMHFVGENAPEIIQGFSVAVVNGLTKSQIDKTIGIHPTIAEELVTMK